MVFDKFSDFGVAGGGGGGCHTEHRAAGAGNIMLL